jgi:hypothetical protein
MGSFPKKKGGGSYTEETGVEVEVQAATRFSDSQGSEYHKTDQAGYSE